MNEPVVYQVIYQTGCLHALFIAASLRNRA